MIQNLLRMPRLSDSMSEATIVASSKQPGELFLRGQPLVEVETDKATVEYGAGAGAGAEAEAEYEAEAHRQRLRAPPVARETASHLGISLHGLTATGPGADAARFLGRLQQLLEHPPTLVQERNR